MRTFLISEGKRTTSAWNWTPRSGSNHQRLFKRKDPGILCTTALWNHAPKQARRVCRFRHSSRLRLVHLGRRVTLPSGGLNTPAVRTESNFSARPLHKSWLSDMQLQTSLTFTFWWRCQFGTITFAIIFTRGSLQWCDWVRREWGREPRKEAACSQNCFSAGNYQLFLAGSNVWTF